MVGGWVGWLVGWLVSRSVKVMAQVVLPVVVHMIPEESVNMSPLFANEVRHLPQRVWFVSGLGLGLVQVRV